jgi:hypothetical protein
MTSWEGVAQSSGARLGRWRPTGEGVEFATPCYLLYSRRGVVPHLTETMLAGESGIARQRLACRQLALGEMWNEPGTEVMQTYGRGLRAFFGWPADTIVVGTLRDPAEPSVDYERNRATSISVATHAGRKQVRVGGARAASAER